MTAIKLSFNLDERQFTGKPTVGTSIQQVVAIVAPFLAGLALASRDLLHQYPTFNVAIIAGSLLFSIAFGSKFHKKAVKETRLAVGNKKYTFACSTLQPFLRGQEIELSDSSAFQLMDEGRVGMSIMSPWNLAMIQLSTEGDYYLVLT